jgi:hypothetical protein
MSIAPSQNGTRLDQQDAGLGVDKAGVPKSRYVPPHLRGKPGGGSEEGPPPPDPRDGDRGQGII